MSATHTFIVLFSLFLPLSAAASPQPPELDRLLVSFVEEGEGELWLQGDYISDSLIPASYGNEHSGIDFSKTLQLGGKYGLSNEWNMGLRYGLHDDQAWRSGEPQTARSQYQSEALSFSRLLYSGNRMDVSAHIGWRAHTADELFEDAYSIDNKPLSQTTTAYASNNQLTIDQQQSKQITLDFTTHNISLEQESGTDFSLTYRTEGDAFYLPQYGSLLTIGTGAFSDSAYLASLGTITSAIDLTSSSFVVPLNNTLVISDPTTPYTYLTRASAYDKGVTGGFTSSFYPSSRIRYSFGVEYRQIEVAPQFFIHPDLINNTNQIANAAEQMASFITNDATDSSGNTNLTALSALSGESAETFDDLATLLSDGATNARNYLTTLEEQLPQTTPWDEHHMLLSASMDWWPYDDLGWAAEYTWYRISRSGYDSLQGKVDLSVEDQTNNHQVDGWMFVKPTPDLTLYLHGRVYSNFLLGDRPLLYNARVNHRFDDPFGHISAGIVWQF